MTTKKQYFFNFGPLMIFSPFSGRLVTYQLLLPQQIVSVLFNYTWNKKIITELLNGRIISPILTYPTNAPRWPWNLSNKNILEISWTVCWTNFLYLFLFTYCLPPPKKKICYGTQKTVDHLVNIRPQHPPKMYFHLNFLCNFTTDMWI